MPNAPKPFMGGCPPFRERCLEWWPSGTFSAWGQVALNGSFYLVKLQAGSPTWGRDQLTIWIGVPSGRFCSSLVTSAGGMRMQPFETCLPSTLGSCQPCTPTMPPYGQVVSVGEKAERARVTGSYGRPGAAWLAQM